MRPICWISWEDHRRSRELARRLDGEYIVIRSEGRTGIRHLLLAFKTVTTLWKKRDHTIIVQNPSRVLAAVASLFKLVLRYPLIVDRHTNFRLGKGVSLNPAIWFVIICSEFSLRVADLTIVTNSYLRQLVEKKGGRAFVLTDPIPTLTPSIKCPRNRETFTVFFVCTFSKDEPYREVVEAAKRLDNSVLIKISGNYNKADLDLKNLPETVELTGFVPNEKYDQLIWEADAVMALTTAEWCLVCGGYEAMSSEKPLITSATKSLRGLYGDYALYTDHSPDDIADSILKLKSDYNKKKEGFEEFKQIYSNMWIKDFNSLLDIMKYE